MAIILFDIDGTLVRTGGAGKAAMEDALRAAFGVAEVRDGVPYAGRTDRAIARDLLLLHGIEPSLPQIHRLQEAYLQRLPLMLQQRGGNVCPGVPELLRRLEQQPQVVLGLLTGNIRRGAEQKLAHFGLWEYFCGGGFGDDFLDRDDVARSAVADIERRLGRRVRPQEIWVVGDTPLDVQCARAIGARAVAVATGWHPPAALAACQPDHLLPDLTAAEPLLSLWRNGS